MIVSEPQTIEFWVPGTPATAGSKTPVPIYRGKGRYRQQIGTRVLDGQTKEQREKKKAWRRHVQAMAREAMRESGWCLTNENQALALSLLIVRRRPKDHMREGQYAGLVKDWALELRPITQPDATKVLRAAEDALTGVLWNDDAQIVDQHVHRIYGDQIGMSWGAEGLKIRVAPADVWADQ